MESSKEKVIEALHHLKGKVKEAAGIGAAKPSSEEGAGGRIASNIQSKVRQFQQYWSKK